jgi:5-methylthioribose kinase
MGDAGVAPTKMSDPLDIEDPLQLEHYLRLTGRIGAGESIEIRNLAGGVSNTTVCITRPSGESWVLKQALPKLRVQVDWFSDPLRIHREAAALRWLPKLAPAGTITPLIFEDQQHHLLAMQAVPQPHENWKTMLLTGRIDRDHVAQFAELLALIHRRSSEHRDELSREFEDRSFFESLRLEPYYFFTAQQEPRAAKLLHDLIEQTRATRVALVHGDYSPKNILVHNNRLVLLDHEVIHWGDPAFDLGFALTHLLSKANHLSSVRNDFLREAVRFWATYVAEFPSDDIPPLADRARRHLLACMLARTIGRSPLEYLNDEERNRQREIVVALMNQPCDLVPAMVEFIDRLN